MNKDCILFEMQEIAKLIKVLCSLSDKSNIQFRNNKQNSLEYKFINGILNDKFKTDKEAALNLYGTDQADVRYKMLKHRTKRKLYRQLQNIELDNGQTVLHKEQECLRLYNLAKLLLKKNQLDIVLGLCSKIKSLAIPLEFNELVLGAYEMESICLSNRGTLKQFLKAKAKENEYQKIINRDREAVGLYQNTKVHLKSSIKHRKEYLDELPQIINRLRIIWESNKSFESYSALFKTSILNYELIGDFGEIIKITEEANKYVQSGQLNALRFDISYNAFILVYAHLRNKSFERGLEYAEKYIIHFDSSTINWFSYMENYFLLAIHAKQYELASILLNKVQENSQFKQIPINSRERWQLNQAYLNFFKPALYQQESFNYQKFINSFTSYSKDKQGFNVAILILQFIYFLKKNDSEALLYRIESLKKYSSTHLKDANSLRSKLFLKLLMLTVTEDFDSNASRLKGEKTYQKLSETPTPGDAYAEIEIIPYEHLWEMVLEILVKRD